MPLHEYQCDACGKRFEVIQKFSEVSDTCRLCGKGPVHRQVSAPGFQFKGTGWYITDYAQKGKPGGDAPAGKSESGEKGDAQKTDAKKTDGGTSDSSTKSDSTATPSTATTTPKS